MTVRIVTDSACDLTEEEVAALDIDVVPLFIRFGEVEYIDGKELSVPDFYKEMSSNEHLPQTAAPSPGSFGEIFTQRLNAGAESIVCINLSSELSATMESAQAGAQESGGDVRIVDSRSVSAGQGTIVLAAAHAAKNGASADEIVSLVSDLSSRTRVYGALDTLENLKKGGRVGNAAALFGSVLSIKPLIDISSGVVEEAGKQRTMKKALAWLAETIKEHGDNLESLSIAHAMAPDIDLFAEELQAVTNLNEIRISVIGPVVASHGGPGLVAISFVLKN